MRRAISALLLAAFFVAFAGCPQDSGNSAPPPGSGSKPSVAPAPPPPPPLPKR